MDVWKGEYPLEIRNGICEENAAPSYLMGINGPVWKRKVSRRNGICEENRQNLGQASHLSFPTQHHAMIGLPWRVCTFACVVRVAL